MTTLWEIPTSTSTAHDDEVFDLKHPGVYSAFADEARKVFDLGFKHYSARTIIHFLRHYTAVRDGSVTWKLDNRVSPYLARRLIRDQPMYAGWFELRRSQEDCR